MLYLDQRPSPSLACMSCATEGPPSDSLSASRSALRSDPDPDPHAWYFLSLTNSYAIIRHEPQSLKTEWSERMGRRLEEVTGGSKLRTKCELEYEMAWLWSIGPCEVRIRYFALSAKDTGPKVERAIRFHHARNHPRLHEPPQAMCMNGSKILGVECQLPSGVWAVGFGLSSRLCSWWTLAPAARDSGACTPIPYPTHRIRDRASPLHNPMRHDYSRPLLCICHDPFLKSSSGTLWLQHSMSLAVASDLFSVAIGGQSLPGCRDTTSRSLTVVLWVGGIVYLGDLDYIRFVMSCPSFLLMRGTRNFTETTCTGSPPFKGVLEDLAECSSITGFGLFMIPTLISSTSTSIPARIVNRKIFSPNGWMNKLLRCALVLAAKPVPNQKNWKQ